MPYQFHLHDLEIKDKLPLNNGKIGNALINRLFETWATPSQQQDDRRVKAILRQRTEGRSLVKVFELAFYFADNQKRAATFILRFHPDEDDANQEKKSAQAIQSTASQYFADFVDESFGISGLVVYRHVTDQTGADVYELNEYLCHLISTPNEVEINFFAKNCENFLRHIVKFYDNYDAETKVYGSCSAYYNNSQIESQLPPDLIISGYVNNSRDNTIIIEYDNSSPNSNVLNNQPSISTTQLVNQFGKIKNKDEKWIKIKDICLTSQNFLVGRNDIVYFQFFSAGMDNVPI